MQGRLVLISKDKTECPALNDIRAISVLAVITNFFEAAIMHNFEKAIIQQKSRGFTKGYSTINNIREVLFLAKTIKENKTTNTPALIFFYFVKAYVSVPRDKLIEKLLAFEIHCNVVKLVNSMLNKFKWKTDNETIKTHRGLIQGSMFSQIIFNLFKNDLLIEYTKEDIEVRAYADDIVWISSSIDQTKKAILMRDWWVANGMIINERKSGILRILKRAGKIKSIDNALNIPEVSTYKYLGW